MRSQGEGRILITGSIAGFMPGSYQAVYNGTKAFLDSFSYALREELKYTGVTVTCLMPGAMPPCLQTAAAALARHFLTRISMKPATSWTPMSPREARALVKELN
jgi:short-subunit dehydrogenase